MARECLALRRRAPALRAATPAAATAPATAHDREGWRAGQAGCPWRAVKVTPSSSGAAPGTVWSRSALSALRRRRYPASSAWQLKQACRCSSITLVGRRPPSTMKGSSSDTTSQLTRARRWRSGRAPASAGHCTVVPVDAVISVNNRCYRHYGSIGPLGPESEHGAPAGGGHAPVPHLLGQVLP